MMNEHLINKAADWFNDVEKWKSFLELCEAKSAIELRWQNMATDELRKYFVLKPSVGWDFTAWGCNRDTWWFLNDFGSESVGIGFGYGYWLCFGAKGDRVNRALLKNKLMEKQYAPLLSAFGVIHVREAFYGFEFAQEREFSFEGSSCNGRMSESEFACYSWNHREYFLRQAVAKIEAFTKNDEITKLLAQLNRETINS